MGLKLFDRKFGKDFAASLPTSPGVYLFRDDNDDVLYVGKAVNLRRRLADYRNASRRKAHRKMRKLVRAAANLEIRTQPDERAALLAENDLIRRLRPPFNVDGAYSFLYPIIGVEARADHRLFCFTTEPERWADFDFHWHGAFRSRPRAREAFDVLVETLTLLAHREPRSRLPTPPRRNSRLVGFRRINPDLTGSLDDFLAGRSPAVLVELAEQLLEKPRARREAEVVEENLKLLSAFYESDLRRLRQALDGAGIAGTFIAQAERDALFIRSAAD